MEIEWIIAYLASGALVGLVAGLLGVGGGGIMVPILTSIFAAQGVAEGQIVHMALGTAMASIVLTATSSVRAHHRHGAVLWPVVWKMVPGILIGTFAATYLAASLSSRVLTVIFACFMSYVVIKMLIGRKQTGDRPLPRTPVFALVGAGIGAISALVALGGGALSVTFLSAYNVNIRQAIATSAAIGLPLAIAGTIGYIVNGLGIEGRPVGSLGFVSVPAVALICLTSFMTAPLGAKLTHTLPIPLIRKIFAALILVLITKMLITIF